MAKKTPEIPQETVLKISVDEFKSLLQERINQGKEIFSFEVSNASDFEINKDNFNRWHDYNLEFLKRTFTPQYNEYRKRYDEVGVWTYSAFAIGGRSTSPREKVLEFKNKVNEKIKNLENLLAKADLIPSSIQSNANVSITGKNVELTSKIFIVHGHDDKTKIEVARTLEKLGLSPIILHEQANEGKTIIEKFELHSEVGFAVVIMTCDDLGKAKTSVEEEKYRARQNVILEMGYFIGKLGRDRVFPLYENGVELPSDLYGLLYNALDERGTWKFELVKELKAAGYSVSADSIL